MAYSHDINLIDPGPPFNIDFGFTGIYSLSVQSTTHIQTSEKTLATPRYFLAVNDAAHAEILENILLDIYNPGEFPLSKVGTFLVDTTKTPGQTQVITGLGFQPKAILFWWSGTTHAENWVGSTSAGLGVGVASSGSGSWFVTGYSQDTTTTSLTGWQQSSASPIGIMAGYTSLDGTYSSCIMDVDGFTLTVANQFSTAYNVSYLALGGDTLQDVYIGEYSTPTSTGEFDVNNVGFKPSAVIFAATNASLSDSSDTDMCVSVGMATSDNQGVIGGYSDSLTGTGNTRGYGYNGEIIVFIPNSVLSIRESFVSFHNDGFRINHLEGTTTRNVKFIALRGGKYSVGELTTKTNTDYITETIGFKPSAILFGSAERPLSVQDTLSTEHTLSMGAASTGTAPSEENLSVQTIGDKHNIGNMIVSAGNYNDAVYAHVLSDTLLGKMTLKHFINDGFIRAMSLEDSEENWVTYLAIGGLPIENEYILIPNDSSHLQLSDNTTVTQPQFSHITNSAIMIDYREKVKYTKQTNAAIMVEYRNNVNYTKQSNAAIMIEYRLHYALTTQDATQLQNSDNTALTANYSNILETNAGVMVEYVPLSKVLLTDVGVMVEYIPNSEILLTNIGVMVEYRYYYVLTIQDSTQLQISDNTTLITDISILMVNDSTHLQDSDNITVTYDSGIDTLIVQDTVHVQSCEPENLTLTSHYGIIMNTNSAIMVEYDNKRETRITNVAIIVEYAPLELIVNNSAQSQTSENIILTANYFFISDITHIQTADNIVITYNPWYVSLTVQDATQIIVDLFEVPNFILIFPSLPSQLYTEDNDDFYLEDGDVLLLDGAEGGANQAQTADNVIITYHEETNALTIQDAIQIQNSENILLSAHYSLTVNNTAQLQTASYFWWLTDGLINSNVAGAYQAKGAGTYSNSLLNLVENIYNLTTSNPPTWDNINGWGTNNEKWLQTGITPSQGWSILVRFSNITSGIGRIFGVCQNGDSNPRWEILPNYSGGNSVLYFSNGTTEVVPQLPTGILGMAGQQGYRNGIADGGEIPYSAGTITRTLILLATQNGANIQYGVVGYMQAVAIYNITLNATQMYDITRKMNFLENMILSAHYTLTINNSTQTQNSDNVIITYIPGTITLTVQDTIQLQTSDNIELTQHYTLTINNTLQLQTSDNANLNAHYNITIQDTIQSQTSDSINLSAHYGILINNSTQLQTSDSANLSAHYIITINDIVQLQASDNVNLSAHYAILSNNSTHLETSDNVDLSAHYGITISDAIHLQTSDNINLSAHYSVAIQDSIQLQTSDNVILTQHQILIIDNALQLLTSENIILLAHYTLTIDNIIQLQTSENIALIQHQVLSIQDIIQIQTSDNAILFAHYSLTINDATQQQTSDTIILVPHNIYVLMVNDVTQIITSDEIYLIGYMVGILSMHNTTQWQAVDNIDLVQHHILLIDNSIQPQTSDDIILIQHHILTTDNSTQLHTCDNTTLFAHYTVSANDTIQEQTADNIELIQHQVLIVNDIIQLQESNNIVLFAHYAIISSDVIQIQTSENVALIQHQLLTIDNVVQGQISDNIGLFAHYIIVINDVIQTQISENIILTQHQVVEINNSTQEQTSESIVLFAHYSLSIEDCSQIQASENIILNANYILTTVNDTVHYHTSDNIVLFAHYGLISNDSSQTQTSENIILFAHYSLTTNDSIQTQSSDNIILVQNYNLIIYDSSQVQASDDITLIQNYNLTINETIHLQTADNITLIPNYNVIISDSIHLQTSDNITLTQKYLLTINDTVHPYISDNINLVAHYSLVINDSSQTQNSDNVNLSTHYILTLISNVTQTQLADGIILTTQNPFIVQNSAQIQSSENVSLTQSDVLVVNNSTQTQISENIVLTILGYIPPGIMSKAGYFTVDTTKDVGQTQSITNLGFQPKLVLFWWGGSGSAPDYVSAGNVSFGVGAASSGSSRWYNSTWIQDNSSNSSSYKIHSSSYCIAIFDTYGSANGVFDFTSMDIDGFTIDVTTKFTKTYSISYLALGGNDLTDVWVNSFDMPATTGSYAITGVGFKPDAMLFSSVNQTSGTASASSALISLGITSGASSQGTVGFNELHNARPTNTAAYASNNEVYAIVSQTEVTRRGALLSFDTNGFTINQLEATDVRRVFGVALKGGRFSVGEFTSRTDSNDIVETVDFQPSALLFLSSNIPLPAQDTRIDNARISMGAATSTINRTVQAFSDEDNLNGSEVAHGNYNAIYLKIVDDAAVGVMDIKSINGDGFTTVMDDADTEENWITYLAIGSVSVPLTVHNCTQLQNADNTSLITDIVILITHDCIQSQTSGNPGLVSSLPVLTLQNTIQSETSENVVLFAHYTLTIQNATQTLISDKIFLIYHLYKEVFSRVGSFNIDPSKTVGQNHVITGLGFKPKLVIFWCSGGTATGSDVARGTFNIVFGAATSDGTRFGIGSISEDNQTTSDNYHWTYSTSIIRIYNNTGSVNGVLDFVSMDDGGFTTQIDDQFTSAFKINYLALGGDTFEAFISYDSFRTTPGTDRVYIPITPYFKPDALIFATAFSTTTTGGTANTYFNLGIASGSTSGKQGTASIKGTDNVGTTSTNSYGYNNEIMASAITAGDGSYRSSLYSLNTDGFTTSIVDTGTAYYYYYIALKGASFIVGDMNTRTDGTDIVLTTGFKPSALLMFSNNRPLSTIDQPTIHGAISIGAVDYMDNQAVASIWEENGVSPSKDAYGNYNSATYLNISGSSTLGVMNVKSLDINGFTANMSVPDTSENWITYLAIGVSPTLLEVQDSTHLNITESPIIEFYLNPARGDDAAHYQTADNIDLHQNYTLTISDTAQTQTAENTHIITDIVILGMNNSTQNHMTGIINLIVFKISIFAFKKISFGIGKKGAGM